MPPLPCKSDYTTQVSLFQEFYTISGGGHNFDVLFFPVEAQRGEGAALEMDRFMQLDQLGAVHEQTAWMLRSLLEE